MNYDITFPQKIIDNINMSGIFMISAILIIGFILLMRYAATFMPGILALLTYLVLVVAGVQVVTSVFLVIPGLNALIVGTPIVFYITQAILYALLTHLTRMIVVKFSNRNNTLELGDSLMGGLGIAIGQAILPGMELMALSSMGTTINAYGMTELFQDRTAEEFAEIVEYVQQVISAGPSYYLSMGINGMLDIIFHVGVLLLLYAIVKKGLPVFWNGIIIGMDAVITGASFLAKYVFMENYAAFTLTKVAVVILLVIVALRVDADYLDGELRSFSKLKKSSGKMPKFNNLKNK